jgi:hypothetical protein
VTQVRSAFHKFIILCCALYLSGAHWTVLQTTAWTGMLLSRSLSASVEEAFGSTFDGQHPCRMCEVISSGKQSEERSKKEIELLKKGGDLKFVELCGMSVPPRIAGTPLLWPEWNVWGEQRKDAPPTPPPLS